MSFHVRADFIKIETLALSIQREKQGIPAGASLLISIIFIRKVLLLKKETPLSWITRSKQLQQ